MTRLNKEVERLKTEYDNYDKALLLGQNRLNYLKKELMSYSDYNFERINLLVLF